MTVTGRAFPVHRMENAEQAQDISDFLRSPCSFDDQRLTPGESEYFERKPAQSLNEKTDFFRFIRNDQEEIIAVNIFRENEQKTGGYIWDYMVVRRDFRKMGIGSALIEDMLNLIRLAQGRYLIAHTCDLEVYRPMYVLFEKFGFQKIGHYPDYYFENEGRYSYMLRISR